MRNVVDFPRRPVPAEPDWDELGSLLERAEVWLWSERGAYDGEFTLKFAVMLLLRLMRDDRPESDTAAAWANATWAATEFLHYCEDDEELSEWLGLLAACALEVERRAG